MKKILFSFSTTNLGGAEYQIFNLIKGLDKDKYIVEILVFLEDGKISEWYRNLGIKVTCLNGYKNGKMRMARKLISYLRNNDYDFIYTFGYGADILTRLIAPFTKNKNLLSTKRSVDKDRSKIRIFFDRITSGKIKYYISNSKSAVELLKKREKVSESKIKYIPNGIDSEKFKKNISKNELRKRLNLPIGKFIVINVANLRPVKNQKLLLDMAAELKGKNIDLLLVIVGEGIERRKLEKIIREKEIENNVLLTGRKENVGEYLCASDLFVLVSLWEGMPGSVMEAMACSLPVISTDVGDIKELVENNINGYIIGNNSEKELMKKVVYLYNNRNEVDKFGKKSFLKIKNYSFGKMIREHERIFFE